MKRRRGRRGFWWWSWLLLLVTIGCVVGGFFYGEKRWEAAPKDYVSAATVSFHVRKPFVARDVGIQQTNSGIANLNEAAAMRDIRNDKALAPIVTELSLTQKWGLGTDDAVDELRESIELDFVKETKELFVIVTRPDPTESAEIANAVAAGIAPSIKASDDLARAEGVKKLESELEPLVTAEMKARTALTDAFAANDIKVEIQPGMDMSSLKPYLIIADVLSAKLEWDAAQEELVSTKRGQAEYAGYWSQAVKPSIVTVKAVPPPTFDGPDLRPFQMQWALYGLTVGMVAGSLLSLLCWKLFP